MGPLFSQEVTWQGQHFTPTLQSNDILFRLTQKGSRRDLNEEAVREEKENDDDERSARVLKKSNRQDFLFFREISAGRRYSVRRTKILNLILKPHI